MSQCECCGQMSMIKDEGIAHNFCHPCLHKLSAWIRAVAKDTRFTVQMDVEDWDMDATELWDNIDDIPFPLTKRDIEKQFTMLGLEREMLYNYTLYVTIN